MVKGIKAQLESNSISKVRSSITLDDIKAMRDYIFKTPSNKELENNLYITHNDEYLCFKTNNLTTGLERFKNTYKAGFTLGLENVYYNDVLLGEKERKEVLNRLLKE